MTLSEACEAYRRDVIVFQNQSKKTEENHYIAVKSLLEFLGDMEISSLQFEHVRKWKEHLDKNRSPATVRNYIIKLRVILAHTLKLGVKCLDPDLIAVPKRPEKVPTFISSEQVSQLISSTNKIKNKAIISLLYASGIRISELCRLDRSDIRDDGTFTVVGKGGKPRLCFTDERTRTLIDLYLESRTDNNPALFLAEYGQKRITSGTIQETFKTIRKRSGIECSPHTLRHSFATNLLKNNANMRYVQVMLGHQSMQTTQMYTHVVDLDLQEVYQKHHTV